MNIQEHKICQSLLATIEKSIACPEGPRSHYINDYNEFLRAVNMRQQIESAESPLRYITATECWPKEKTSSKKPKKK